MRRAICLGFLIATGGLSIAAANYQAPSQQQPQGIRVPDMQKIGDNLYVIDGGGFPQDKTAFTGSNTTVFITERGVVLVDTKNPGWGQMILDKVKSVTSKPVTTIINTHTHSDHTGSNAWFPEAVEIVTHENTKANLMKDTCPPVTNCHGFKGENAKFLPDRTFKDRLSLFSGKDQVDLYYFGRGHTDGDTFVVFPAARVAATGDLFQFRWIPNIDAGNGGSGVAWSQTLSRALATIKNVDTWIPGHARPTTVTDIQEHVEFHRDFVAIVREGVKAGKSVDEMASAFKMPDKYAGYVSSPQSVRNYIQAVYNEIKK
jgi:glyoxylase-like metal-dependent hydrolase (beta-lactamase superfamily II)